MSVAWVWRSRSVRCGLGQVGGLVLLGFVHRGAGLGQAGVLGGQVTLLFDAFAAAVLQGVLVDEALLGQVLQVGLALAGDGQGGFELGDALAHGGGFGAAAGVLGIQLGQAGLDVLPFGLQLSSGVAAGLRQARPERRGPACRERTQQGRGALHLRVDGLDLLLHAVLVGLRVGRVEFHQHLAGLHRVAVAHQHALDDAGFERLDGLGALADHDAARRHGDDVDLAEPGPEQGDGEEGADGDRRAARRRVHGRLLQAQRGRHEGGFVGQAFGAGEFVAGLPGGGEDGFVARKQVDDGVVLRRHIGVHVAPPLCIAHNLAYTPWCLSSASCGPASTMRPLSITTMR